jgi:hypothetical protein
MVARFEFRGHVHMAHDAAAVEDLPGEETHDRDAPPRANLRHKAHRKLEHGRGLEAGKVRGVSLPGRVGAESIGRVLNADSPSIGVWTVVGNVFLRNTLEDGIGIHEVVSGLLLVSGKVGREIPHLLRATLGHAGDARKFHCVNHHVVNGLTVSRFVIPGWDERVL